jgi:hypothetical protein
MSAKLCCILSPRDYCTYCEQPMCDDCGRIRELKKKEAYNWHKLAPGYSSCTPRDRNFVFDGHYYGGKPVV